MVRLGKHFASAALLAVAVAAPAVSQSGATPATAANPSAVATPQATPTSTAATHPKTHRKKKPEPVAQVPPTPPPPPTLDKQPPTAPQVSYRDGLLSINAPNSTLSSVLRAVQSQTGATMDVPSSANNDRIAMAIGPGQPRDVLHTLLNGSTFDYMILGVPGRPGAIQKVILTPKTAGGTSTNQAANTPPTAEEPVDDAADTSGESEYPGPPEQQQQPVPPGAFRRPMGAPGGQAYQQDQQGQQQSPFPPGESDNVVKTPEQLMQELQQMQQQQQQYEQQLNPANQNPPQ